MELRLSRRTSYADDYRALLAECTAKGVALRLIKTVARRNWLDGQDHDYATWYQPLEDAEQIRAAVSWALAEPGVAGIAAPGDVRLLAACIAAEADRLDQSAAEDILAVAPDLSSPFINAPI